MGHADKSNVATPKPVDSLIHAKPKSHKNKTTKDPQIMLMAVASLLAIDTPCKLRTDIVVVGGDPMVMAVLLTQITPSQK
jgi:hypothetical protein